MQNTSARRAELGQMLNWRSECALAKDTGEPLLFKGEDICKTDVAAARWDVDGQALAHVGLRESTRRSSPSFPARRGTSSAPHINDQRVIVNDAILEVVYKGVLAVAESAQMACTLSDRYDGAALVKRVRSAFHFCDAERSGIEQ